MESNARTEDSTAAVAAGPDYVDEARRGERSGWRYLVGLAAALLSWVLLGGAASVAVALLLVDGSGLGPVSGFVVTMSTFPLFLAGLAVVVTRIHRRPFRTLVTGRASISWRRVGQGFSVWLLLWCLVNAGQAALAPDAFSLTVDLASFALFVPLALVLTAIQTTTEELFFRGYVVQAAAIVWGSRVVLALISAVAFTVPHLFNPEAGAGGWLTVLFGYFLGTGLVWAIVSLVDGTTELAIGAHFANNIAGILIVNTAGTAVATPALATVAEYDPVLSALSSVVIVPLFLVITLRWLRRDPSARPEGRAT